MPDQSLVVEATPYDARAQHALHPCAVDSKGTTSTRSEAKANLKEQDAILNAWTAGTSTLIVQHLVP
jgi:hypothetical protein